MASSGFGEVENRRPLWKSPKEVDPEKLELAEAQHRLARAIRMWLAKNHMDEADLERMLDIDRHRFVRKLNGTEAMTVKDLYKLSKIVGPSVMQSFWK